MENNHVNPDGNGKSCLKTVALLVAILTAIIIAGYFLARFAGMI